jgi:hypothetical protein
MVELYSNKRTTMQAISELTLEGEHRPYLGMSSLGHSCERFLWYTFRWAYKETISARMARLFDRGHREEPAIVSVLERIGMRFYGAQEEIVAIHGHCKGHIDGRLMGVIEAPKTEHLAEFKTMNDKSFKGCCKEGVKLNKPVYFAQMQVYMGGTGLTRALFVAVNKNDDAMYVERVRYEEDTRNAILDRAESVILSETPPPKKFQPTWYECRWCSAKDICHGGEPWETNCRTCHYCDMFPDGAWGCDNYDIPLSTSQQRLGCKQHVFLDGATPF